MLKKIPMYWKCQLIGWMIYSITLYLFGLAAKIDQTSLIQAIIQYALIGFLLTHLMKTILLKMIATNKSFKTQVFYFFSVTLLFSILATILFRLTELGLSLYELDVDMDAKSIFFVRTLLAFSTFLTWNLIYFSYHYIEKNRKEQIEKIRFEKELQIQKLKSEKTQAEMRQQATELQIEAIVATQEQERKRISRDLHDDVGTKLSALNLYLYSLSEKATLTSNEEIRSLAQSSRQFIKETIQDVRELLLNLSPTVLEEFGYTTAVEVLINKLNETKQIRFDLVVFGINNRLQKDYELGLYRITQELINNVLKHAEAKHVSLQIGQRDEKIILMMEDNGKGFDVDAHKDGYGLNNLDARTKLMQGTMIIDSQPGKGTSVLIEIPYNLNGV